MLVSDLSVPKPDLTVISTQLRECLADINKALEKPSKFPVMVKVRKGPLEMMQMLRFIEKVYESRGWKLGWTDVEERSAMVHFNASTECLLEEMGYASKSGISET